MMLPDDATLGEIIDGLGTVVDLDGGDLCSAAVVVLKSVDMEGGTSLHLGWSDGLDWVDRLGMLRVAVLNEEQSATSDEVA